MKCITGPNLVKGAGTDDVCFWEVAGYCPDDVVPVVVILDLVVKRRRWKNRVGLLCNTGTCVCVLHKKREK